MMARASDGVKTTVTPQQIGFFSKLLEEKDFGDKDVNQLREQFMQLNVKSASAWIESAIKLPKIDDSDEPLIEPAF
jgi:hypothetical protein